MSQAVPSPASPPDATTRQPADPPVLLKITVNEDASHFIGLGIEFGPSLIRDRHQNWFNSVHFSQFETPAQCAARLHALADSITARFRDNQQLIQAWIAKPAKRGRHTCPCGFTGGSRNILQHRVQCPVWHSMMSSPSLNTPQTSS